MKTYELLLLDLDDTVLDNKCADIESFRRTLKNHRIVPPSRDMIVRWRKNGMLAENIFRKIINNNPKLVQKCIRERLEFLTGEKSIEFLKPRDDAYSSLEKISSIMDIVVVTSRKQRNNVEKILRRCRLEKFVDRILCEEDIGKGSYNGNAELKQMLYGLAIDGAGYKKSRIAAVGNLKSDIVAGKNLGLRTYGIKGSYRFDSGLKGMTKVYEDLESIAAWLVQGKGAVL